MLLIAVFVGGLCGCDPEPTVEKHVLPVGFEGVYRVDNTRRPACVNGECPGLVAAFADGEPIPLFSPLDRPISETERNASRLLGLFDDGDETWFAVGSYDGLERLHADFLDAIRIGGETGLRQFLTEKLEDPQSQGTHPASSIAITLSSLR